MMDKEFIKQNQDNSFIVKPRGSITSVNQYLYLVKMKQLMGFLPDFMKQKLLKP